MARVNVSHAVWIEFRSACLVEGEHVADALGRLVESELRRRARAAPRCSTLTEAAPTLFDGHHEQET